MRVRGHLHPLDPAPARDRDHVQYQGPSDPAPHPPGLDEQILDLEGIPGALIGIGLVYFEGARREGTVMMEA